ncbi:MAG: family 20 glycosylhydrolase [Planctomycetota bacterium]|nr:family 20 glycosylhydrolase [Planctomycetota bacterium]
MIAGLAAQALALDANVPPIQPTPKHIKVNPGSMPLTAGTRIVVTDPRLEAHAAVLADEIWTLTDAKPALVKGEARDGDIVLKINPALRADEDILAAQNVSIVRTRDMAHTISVADQAVVEGWDVRAVCEGTASLVQSIAGGKGKSSLPHMEVKDWPHADFSGTMIDCGRQWIPVDALKAAVVACRLFKIRYMELHLGDDQGYSCPSKALPRLGNSNQSCMPGGKPCRVWTWKEIAALEAFAAARGACIVPEIETPGHHGAMARSYRDLFEGPGCMDMASEELYKGLETLIDEMCGVFKSTPYFDIGCDECNWGGVGAGPWAQVYKRNHAVEWDPQGARNPHELYQVHLKRLSDMLRKRGKLTLAWEDFPRDGRMKDNIIPFIWYPHAVAQDYQREGWTTITVPWDLSVPFPEWNIYICNGSRLGRTDKVLGGNRPMWQMSAICLVNGWMNGVGERTERTWGPDTKINQEEYDKRYELNRNRVFRLATPVKFEAEGVTLGISYFLGGQIAFGGDLKVTLSAAPSGGKIHYTLDDSEPTPQSPVYTEPLRFRKSFLMNAAYFIDGKQFGAVTRNRYDYQDIDGFIADWQYSGPYTMAKKDGPSLFDVAFDPEKASGAKWITRKPGKNPMIVDFNEMGFGGIGTIYLRTQIYSPKAQKALLFVGFDDAAKIWLNGALVLSQNSARTVDAEDRVDISLHAGWNKLVFKVINGGGQWAAKARVRAANGGLLEGLKTKPD